MATLRMAFMRSSIRIREPFRTRSLMFCHPSTRRGYTSGRSKKSKFLEEALWAAGSIAITIPSCWYLLSGREVHVNHHDDGHNSQENSNDHLEEKNSKEIDENSDENSDELVEEKEGVSNESEEEQYLPHNDSQNDTSNKCISCEGVDGDTDGKASSLESVDDQCKKQDGL
ncbi:hypothetical protein EV44_g1975 [Erysiphe necator]|uniref:Uncharacterized protein n=1 Tax=Uncinula necator TaxID=52586 RepID=A0A0B1PCD3_UNCNE|nr:hypothetical protein EV44_g1975 [Erysiphe necator]